jgi:hypothetical protein
MQEYGFENSDLHNFDVTASSDASFAGDMLIVPFYKPADEAKTKGKVDADVAAAALTAKLIDTIPAELSAEIKEVVSALVSDGQFKADASSSAISRVVGQSVKYIALVGLGPGVSCFFS